MLYHFKSLSFHLLDFLLHFITIKHVKISFFYLNSNKFATYANILTKKFINQFEIQTAHEQVICIFIVQTMNMAFNVSTIRKNHHLVLLTKKLASLSQLKIHYDRFIIWRTLQILANCSFYRVKLVPSKRSNFTKPWFNIFKVVPSFTPYLIVKYCLKLLGISPN